MERRKKICDKTLQSFEEENRALMQQPIIQSFLRDQKNWELARQAICCPTEQNKQIVDDAFRTFYGKVRALTYLSNVIHYNAIHFDKNIQKHHSREMLTLDQPLQEDSEGTTHKDMLFQMSMGMDDMIIGETIAEHVENPALYQAIRSLPTKQQQILTNKYIFEMKNKEIADLFGDSPQNISKLHQRALQKLKTYLQKGQDIYDES